MDPDATNATLADPSNAAALTALDCVACHRARTRRETVTPSFAFWIPAR
jgi:hypothetical protein